MGGQRIKGEKWRENIHFPFLVIVKKWREKLVSEEYTFPIFASIKNI